MREDDYKKIEIMDRFRSYYISNLKQNFSTLESIRKEYIIFLIEWLVFGGLIFGGYVCFCKINNFSIFIVMSSRLWLFLCMVCLYIFGWGCAYPFQAFKKKTKNMTMNKILEFFDQKLRYTKNFSISEVKVKQSKFFSYFDESQNEDNVEGEYNRYIVNISEQKLVRFVNMGKFKYHKKIFKGVLIHLDLKNRYKKQIVVCEKENILRRIIKEWIYVLFVLICFYGLYSFWAFCKSMDMPWYVFLFFLIGLVCCFGQMLVALFKSVSVKKEKQVNLEDILFSKTWKVYADDQVEARYVLTPALMERMLAVKKLFHGNRLDFSFWGNNLLIAVHTGKDMFETTSLFKSALDYRKVQEVICQLYSVFSVIDALKLQGESKTGIKKES